MQGTAIYRTSYRAYSSLCCACCAYQGPPVLMPLWYSSTLPRALSVLTLLVLRGTCSREALTVSQASRG